MGFSVTRAWFYRYHFSPTPADLLLLVFAGKAAKVTLVTSNTSSQGKHSSSQFNGSSSARVFSMETCIQTFANGLFGYCVRCRIAIAARAQQ
jgi:hypothetical protein